MADTKITALTAISTVDPAVDVLPIVDVSDTTMAASGTTKKITSNQILGAGGTATLASATITGDLTVASSILKVTGGNVGINTATPTNTAGYKTLEIVGTGVNTGGMIRMKSSDASVSSYDFIDNNGRGIFAVSNHNLRFGCNDIEQYRIQPLGIFTWYDGAGGTRMTLNSTGLGVGLNPSSYAGRLVVGGTPAATSGAIVYVRDTFANGSNNSLGSIMFASSPGSDFYVGKKVSSGVSWFSIGNANSGAEYFQIDSSGNVISNVTGTAPTLGVNSQMVFNLTSNTNLRISVRGTDGVTRVANITLA
jgi:hypothetical protein